MVSFYLPSDLRSRLGEIDQSIFRLETCITAQRSRIAWYQGRGDIPNISEQLLTTFEQTLLLYHEQRRSILLNLRKAEG
jgi:hypothetical protein